MKYRHRVLGLLFLLSIITYLDRVCIAVAGPRMQEDLKISPEWWGWVVGVFAISYAAFEIPSGSISPLLVVVPIQARYGWRASFYVFGFLGVLWAAIWYKWYRDRPAEMS